MNKKLLKALEITGSALMLIGIIVMGVGIFGTIISQIMGKETGFIVLPYIGFGIAGLGGLILLPISEDDVKEKENKQ